MRLVQFLSPGGERKVAIAGDNGVTLRVLNGIERLYDLVLTAIEDRRTLEDLAAEQVSGEVVDYEQVAAENRLLPPLDHPNPAHCIISGTGLDHLGSAQARNAMHERLKSAEEELTDSMKMFKLGLEGGKPAPGQIGVAPEWFYKGDGSWIVPPGRPLELPAFALDGGEESELVGLYVIGPEGQVFRVGFALGNEYADHVLERQNYLYLAHSKLRQCSFGPEIRLGPPPDYIEGVVRVLRGEEIIWSDTFLTGEANMSHSIANIEHHHFKYRQFRRPGDLHCHFFGTSTLSAAAGITTRPGDVFEISAQPFGRPLRNPLAASSMPDRLVGVKAL
jgi:hypothetical protein